MVSMCEAQSVWCSWMVMIPVSTSCTLLPWNSCRANAIAAYTSLLLFAIIFLSFDYIGILPCFLAGSDSRLVAS